MGGRGGEDEGERQESLDKWNGSSEGYNIFGLLIDHSHHCRESGSVSMQLGLACGPAPRRLFHLSPAFVPFRLVVLHSALRSGAHRAHSVRHLLQRPLRTTSLRLLMQRTFRAPCHQFIESRFDSPHPEESMPRRWQRPTRHLTSVATAFSPCAYCRLRARPRDKTYERARLGEAALETPRRSLGSFPGSFARRAVSCSLALLDVTSGVRSPTVNLQSFFKVHCHHLSSFAVFISASVSAFREIHSMSAPSVPEVETDNDGIVVTCRCNEQGAL